MASKTEKKTSIKRKCPKIAESNLWDFGQLLGVRKQKNEIEYQWKQVIKVFGTALLSEFNKVDPSYELPERFFELATTFNLSTILDKSEVEVYLTINRLPFKTSQPDKQVTYEISEETFPISQNHLIFITQAIGKAVETVTQDTTKAPFQRIDFNPQREGLLHLIVVSPKQVTFRVIIAFKELSGKFFLLWNDQNPSTVIWSSYWKLLKSSNKEAPGLLDMTKIWKLLIHQWNAQTNDYIPPCVADALVEEEFNLDIAWWISRPFQQIFNNIRKSFREAIEKGQLASPSNRNWNLLATVSPLGKSSILKILDQIDLPNKPTEEILLKLQDFKKYLESLKNKHVSQWWVEYDCAQKAFRNFIFHREIACLVSDLDLVDVESLTSMCLDSIKTIKPQLKNVPQGLLDATLKTTGFGAGDWDAYLILNSKVPVSYDSTSKEVSLNGTVIPKQNLRDIAKHFREALVKDHKAIPKIDHLRLQSSRGLVCNLILALQTQDNNLILFHQQSEGNLSFIPWKLIDLSQTEYGSQCIQAARILKLFLRPLNSASDNNNQISPTVFEQLAFQIYHSNQSNANWDKTQIRDLMKELIKSLNDSFGNQKVPCYGNASWYIPLPSQTLQRIIDWAQNLENLAEHELIQEAEKIIQSLQAGQATPDWLDMLCTSEGSGAVVSDALQEVEDHANSALTNPEISDGRKKMIQTFLSWIKRTQFGPGVPLKQMLAGVIDPEKMNESLVPYFVDHSKTPETMLCPKIEVECSDKRKGTGSFSICYECTLNNGQPAALKAYTTTVKDNEVRFYREATLLWLLDHPNIIQLFGYTECNVKDLKAFGLVMELMETTLHDWLAVQTVISNNQCLKFSREIASGLAYLHSYGIAHRDLKLNNILVTGNTAKLADVGEAKPDYDNASKYTPIGVDTHYSPEECQLYFTHAPHLETPHLTLKTETWKLGLLLLQLWAKRQYQIDGNRKLPQTEYTETKILPEVYNPDKYGIPKVVGNIIRSCLALENRPYVEAVKNMLLDPKLDAVLKKLEEAQ